MAFELTEQIEEHLVSDQVAWLTTVTPTNRPAPRVVWFLWDGSAITIYSQPDAAKVRHIRANDRVTLNFNSSPAGSDVVVITGTAELVPGAPLPSATAAYNDKYGAVIQAEGFTREFLDSFDVAIRVTPERAWAYPA